MTRRMTAAQATIEFLINQYSERDGQVRRLVPGCFGIFGHGNVAGIGQALQQVGEQQAAGPPGGGARMRYYLARNEQGMAHAAAAYARAANRLQTLACTSSIGPGATNMVTAAAGATINRVPLLLLPGDIFAGRAPAPVLQQLETPASPDVSVNDCFRPVARYWDRVNRPEQLVTSLPAAMRVLTDPAETGTVVLALPQDVQAEAYDYPEELFAERVWRVPRQTPEPAALAQAAQAMSAARRPLLVAGGGVIYSEATEALRALVDTTGVPVAETHAGKGALPHGHPLALGAVGATGTQAGNDIARDADVVVGVGTRWTDFTTASHTAFADPHVRFVNINVTAFDAGKHAGVPVVADARVALEQLAGALGGYRVDPGYRETVEGKVRAWDTEVDRLRGRAGRPPGSGGQPAARPEGHEAAQAQRGAGSAARGDGGPGARPEAQGYDQEGRSRLLAQSEVIGAVNDAAGQRGVVVCASGSMPGDLHKLWRPRDPKQYHVEYGYSCMGYEVAGGLGVKMAAPDRDVFVLVGDGSWLMLSQEIVTSVAEGYPLVVILVDNGGYASIGGLSRSVGSGGYGTRYRYRSASGQLDGEALPVDLAANAASLGARVLAPSTVDDLAKALEQASGSEVTTVVHVRTDPDVGVPSYGAWWDVPVAEEAESADVRAARGDYVEQRRSQRPYL